MLFNTMILSGLRIKMKIKKEDCLTFVFCVFMVNVVSSELSFNVSKWNVCLPTSSRFLALFGISLDECVTECTLRSHCHAVGYMTSVKHCELHTSLNSSDISSSSCLLIHREDMKGDEECSCKDWEVCNPGKSPLCERKECPLPGPLQNGDYLGNLNHFKAKKRVRCNRGFKEKNDVITIECLETGEWSRNVSCILDGCETGWEKFGESCYLFEMSIHLGWVAAEDYCESLGARLVIVQDDSEHNYIREKCIELNVPYLWIGARFDPKFGEHRWIDGSAMNVNGWFSGRPNVQGCVDYLVRIENSDETEYYLWNSHIDCVSTRGPFICEKD